MMKGLCLVFLFHFIILVSSNPLGQLVQSCNVCQPTSYSNPTSIPVVVQQPSNINPCLQALTTQGPASYPGPLGESLNQIVLNRILSNPSFQKVIDPNTRLFNQNGDEIQRQGSKNTGIPNVINNYFIVPPEFFNLNETTSKTDVEVINTDRISKTGVRNPHRRKSKRKLKNIELNSNEEIITRSPAKKRRHKESDQVKQKRKRINSEESSETIDMMGESKEIDAKEQDATRNKRRQRFRQKSKKVKPTPDVEESNEDAQEVVEPTRSNRKNKNERETKPKMANIQSKSKTIDAESETSIQEKPTGKKAKNDVVVATEMISDAVVDTYEKNKNKKEKRKESSAKSSDEKILKNIEIPTDISNRDTSETRKARGSKRNAAKKEPKQKITPFPDDVVNSFFPYMPPMGNVYNPNTNNPYNFDQYYQYLNPLRNSNVNRSKTRRKNQNRKNSEASNKTHTIEIKLKPKKKENVTEIVTTEKPEEIPEVVISIEVEQSKESFEEVTDIPMEMPHKVSPAKKDEVELLSKERESYETFSKLEDLQEFITPELGQEDEVRNINSNGIINDYYPIFDDDVYYRPFVETVETLDDARYFYETGNEDKVSKDKRKYDRYEDSRNMKRDITPTGKGLEAPDIKTTNIEKLNKFDHNEYLDHISKFSDTETPDVVKSSAEILRVKVPPKNTRVQTDDVETVFAESKVAKYGITSHLDETAEDCSTYDQNSDESREGHTTYVVAKSVGRPEDYW